MPTTNTARPEHDRTPHGWPAGKTLAVFLDVMLEGWPPDSPPHNSTSNPVKPGFIDTRGLSWAEYGPKTGAPRLAKIFAAAGVHGTFFTSGVIAERYPDLVARIAQDGHSVQCHGWTQNLPNLYLDEAQEKDTIARSREILTRVTGNRPDGWLSPRVTASVRTPALLAAAGFRWHNDANDADMPYRKSTPAGEIIALPFGNEINDQRLHLGLGTPVETYSATVARMLTRWYARHPEPACLDITVHAHVFGRPSGAMEFERAIELVQRADFAWITTQDAVAKAMFPR